MKIRITKKGRIIIGVVVGIFVFTIGAIVSHYIAEQAAQKQAMIKEQMRLAKERALEYDYDTAIALLQELPDSDTDEEILDAIENYEMLKLKQDLDVYLVSATTSEMEPDSGVDESKFIWECGVANYTDKPIKKMEIILLFQDMYEEVIKQVRCKFDQNVIEVGAKSVETFSVEIGEEDIQLQTVILEELQLDYYIKSIEYEDGIKETFDVYKGSSEKANIEDDK